MNGKYLVKGMKVYLWWVFIYWQKQNLYLGPSGYESEMSAMMPTRHHFEKFNYYQIVRVKLVFHFRFQSIFLPFKGIFQIQWELDRLFEELTVQIDKILRFWIELINFFKCFVK